MSPGYLTKGICAGQLQTADGCQAGEARLASKELQNEVGFLGLPSYPWSRLLLLYIRLFDFGCWRWYELCSISMIVCLEAFEALPATSLLSASMGPVEAKG
ncbi:hypothetical protein EV421DRAFT_2019981 [Armillaria borealis]|uniref:Uncharacterized protein n=1 Tax=Armillaria borealis TaxID=47425 RepID=A0AA39JEN1_9AGAR|nr:hypothetical protein EV421DRAFT_2019981 [Armillaria borealis]